jgi:hypothetical protein
VIRALAYTVLYIVVACGLGYLLDMLVSFAPIPPKIATVLHWLIWFVVVIVCIMIVIQMLLPALPGF